MRVAAVWMLGRSTWRLFVPDVGIDFGLTAVPAVASLLVVLERPAMGVGSAGAFMQAVIDRLEELGYLTAADTPPRVAHLQRNRATGRGGVPARPATLQAMPAANGKKSSRWLRPRAAEATR